jgi:hypothetical protein
MATFFVVLCWLFILSFQMAPCTVLCSIPKWEETVLCLLGKRRVAE